MLKDIILSEIDQEKAEFISAFFFYALRTLNFLPRIHKFTSRYKKGFATIRAFVATSYLFPTDSTEKTQIVPNFTLPGSAKICGLICGKLCHAYSCLLGIYFLNVVIWFYTQTSKHT